MPGRIVRSRTADLVTQLIESRDGRNHLRSHGWEDGMAIVMTQPSEPLEDVMGLVSIHRGAVLVAMIGGMTKDLRFVHVSETSAALHVVAQSALTTLVGEFFDALKLTGTVTFRLRFWVHSAVAHALPLFEQSPVQRYAVYPPSMSKF